MARPKKEGMDYFPHDTDALNDEKIEALRFLYGNDGYAFYFILLERIYRTKNFELDISDTETIQILSRKVGLNEEKFIQILETALKRNCFDRQAYEERKVLTSDGIKKRAFVVVEKRVKMREKYHYSKEISEVVSDAETTQETGEESTQSKEKKSKEKKSINNNSRNSNSYDETSIFFQLASRLSNKIKENNPTSKEPDHEKWANEFRLMIERDNRTEEQLKYLIDWCQQDSFWKTNILSPKNLRKHFDRLVLTIKSEKQHAAKHKKEFAKGSLFDQGEESKKRQAAVKPLTAEEREEMKKWEEELPY
jgi:hypothetical protein